MWGLYKESDHLLQKFMVRLDKQLLGLYDLFETCVGATSSGRMGREDESIPCCLSGPRGSKVLLANSSLWGSSEKEKSEKVLTSLGKSRKSMEPW